MTLLLALMFLLGQSGEGLSLSGLPAGPLSGEVHVERTKGGTRLELRTVEGPKTASLSFWPFETGRGVWQVSGYSRLRPDGLVQRLELRQGETHLIFLDNVERGAAVVTGRILERVDAEAVLLSSGEKRVGLELNTSVPLSDGWCATLLGVALPPEPSREYANEVTEPKVDLFVSTC